MASEFELIYQYFSDLGQCAQDKADWIVAGVGDDCAIIAPTPGYDWLHSVDTLVQGIHFPEAISPESLAQRALAVNLSDLAAMGAEPVAFTLALTLPGCDEGWLRQFARGLQNTSAEYGIRLIGGDTTRGSLSITISVMGVVPSGRAMRRNGAKPGDWVCVSGHLGDAHAGLELLQTNRLAKSKGEDYLLDRFHRPSPRLSLGCKLREFASAAIDISDGVVADLGHICRQSECVAELWADAVPLSQPYTKYCAARGYSRLDRLTHALTHGDDYELCFTISADAWRLCTSGADKFWLSEEGLPVTIIGKILAPEPSGADVLVRVLDENDVTLSLSSSGYQHF